MSTAILVDAAFFLKRFRLVYPSLDCKNPDIVAKQLYTMCHSHVDGADLYRILVYDCAPLDKKGHHPISNQLVDFTKLSGSIFREKLHNQLKKQRKVALRLGYLAGHRWAIRDQATKKLLKGEIAVSDLRQNDVKYDIAQKGVDMKIGLDIASLAIKRMVKQIVLISGDGDFVPAAKLARREGIDFILDPMWAHISDALHEHIDGLKSTSPRPKEATSTNSPENKSM